MLTARLSTVCQKLEGKPNIDYRRLGAVTLYDGLYIGGLLHFLYQLPLI